MEQTKKCATYILIAFFLILGGIFFNSRYSVLQDAPSALADDDESSEASERSERSEDNDEEERRVTTYVKLPDQVVTTYVKKTIYDSDGDGIFDPEDPNPGIHEIYIVKDADLDGIDDSIE